MPSIYNLIEKYKRISIIGMEKNVGKTTVLNKIIHEVRDKKKLSLTSIGRDGEELDRVTNTPKPRIYIYSGTIVATAKQCLNNCDITKEILYVTDFTTPMGNIVIVRALSDGYVDIAGPSFNSQIIEITKIMENFGTELVIVDGALSRKSSASSYVCDATVLVTGASFSKDINHVIEETVKVSESITLNQINDETIHKKIVKNLIEKENRVSFIYEDDTEYSTKDHIFLETDEKFKEKLSKRPKYIGINGAITNKAIDVLIKNRNCFEKLTILALDGTKIFLDNLTYKRAKLSGIEFRVLNKINLIFVACNPVSPLGYSFDKEKFKERLQEKINYPVINVLEEKNEIYR